MGFDVRQRRTGCLGQPLQRADLVHDVGEEIVLRHVDETAAETGQVAIAHLCPDAHAAFGGQLAHRQQTGGIARVETARDVGTGDDAEHGVVVAEPPDAEALTQVGVEVDAGHGR